MRKGAQTERLDTYSVSVVNDVLNTLIKTVSVRKGRVIPRLRFYQ